MEIDVQAFSDVLLGAAVGMPLGAVFGWVLAQLDQAEKGNHDHS